MTPKLRLQDYICNGVGHSKDTFYEVFAVQHVRLRPETKSVTPEDESTDGFLCRSHQF